MKFLNNWILKKAKQIPEWHDEACSYAFKYQSISKDQIFAKMKPCFIDSNGKRYFEFNDLDDMPLPRYEEVQIILQEIGSRITYLDLDQFIDVTLKILNDEKKKTKLSDVVHMLMALQERRKLLYDPYLMFKLVAAIYIREDQNPVIWDEEIEKEKIKQFQKDSQEGLYDFFYNAGLKKYLPGSIQSKSGLMQQQEAENMQEQILAFKELLASLHLS